MRSVETVLLLVAVATVVAAFARRIRLPAPSLLVLAGLGVAMLPGAPSVQVTPEVVSLVVLPPLLYAAGEELSWQQLRRVWRSVTVLAVGLVLASAAVVGFVAAWVVPLPLDLAFVLGAVLASTDPVAVSALGRRLPLPARLQTLVQAESLFNDATSLVLFRLSIGIAVAGGAVTWTHVAGEFVLLAGGGAAIGVAVAAVVGVVRWRTEEPVLESVIALVTPYAAYVLAEAAHASGVTAVVVASVILGVLAPRLTTARIRIQLHAVYGTVIFVLESVVFALIGLGLPDLVERLSEAHQPWVPAAAVITVTLLALRILWVFPMAAIGQRRDGLARRQIWAVTAVVSWAGTRGVVPLAAALSIPVMPERDLLVVLSVSVIAVSLILQGLTLAPLVRRSGIAVPVSDIRDEAQQARQHLSEIGLAALESTAAEAADVERVRARLRARPVAEPEGYRRLRQYVISVQGEELARMYRESEVSDATYRRLQRELDLEEARLSDDRAH